MIWRIIVQRCPAVRLFSSSAPNKRTRTTHGPVRRGRGCCRRFLLSSESPCLTAASIEKEQERRLQNPPPPLEPARYDGGARREAICGGKRVEKSTLWRRRWASLILVGLTNAMHIQEVCTRDPCGRAPVCERRRDNGTLQRETWQRKWNNGAHRRRNETREEIGRW